ncbi:MAG TPA: metallophosphoesterase [Flavihumibacter sp.]|jgi:3',5'-cyclic AMP phosphodiesterase CpdA
MRFILLIAAIITAAACSSNERTADNNSKNEFFFIQLSDPQLGFTPDSLQKEIAFFEKAVARVNELRPDFVVITGDLVHHPQDSIELREFERITKMIDASIPVYLTPGNHDVGNEPQTADLDFYKGIYGDDRFSFEHKGIRAIGLNSSLIKAKTPQWEQEQYEWLEKELAAAQNSQQIYIFCHYPFFVKDADEADEYFNIDLPVRKKYLGLFKQYNVKAVFAGHLHGNAEGRYETISMITTSAVGKPLHSDPNGLRIIKVSGDSFSHKYFHLDSVSTASLKQF